jgi:hypothetical protein
MSLQKTEEILRAEVGAATEHHQEVRREFWRVAAHFPGGTKAENEETQSAAEAELGAKKAVILALERLNQFLSDGTVPEDMNRKARAATASF